MSTATRIQNGRLVAAALEGAWRHTPPASACAAEDLSPIAPLLLSFGCGGLGWRRVRNASLKTLPAARDLQQAYYLHTLQGALHEREIKALIPFLNAAGV